MSRILNIADYTPTAKDSFFVDANIWLFLFYPMGDHAKRQAGPYSNFIAQARKAGAQFYTSGQVLSEFVNRCLDNEFKRNVPDSKTRHKKQDFRETTLYAQSLEGVILPCIKHIRKLSRCCSDGFAACNFEQILEELRIVDFNDACHLQVVRQNQWILLTHDSDFGKIHDDALTIATALPRLLRR